MRGSPHNSLRACGAPFGQTRRVSSRSMCVLRHTCHPARCAPRRIQRGWGTDIHTGHRFARPRFTGASASRWHARPSAAMARVVVGRQPPLLVAPAARRGWRIRARDCLSAAGASSSETPPAPSTAGCGLLGSDTHFTAVRSTAPSGRAEGSVNWGSDPNNPSQTVGSPFLW